MWEHSEKGGRLQGQEVGPHQTPAVLAALILNFQHPELWGSFYFSHTALSGLRHSWALPSDGSILKLFTPICLGFIFLSTVPPQPHHPKQTQNRASSFALSFPEHWPSLCCLALFLLREAAYLNGKGETDKNWINLIICSISQATSYALLLESRGQLLTSLLQLLTTFLGDNFFWLAAQMRTRSQGDRRN